MMRVSFLVFLVMTSAFAQEGRIPDCKAYRLVDDSDVYHKCERVISGKSEILFVKEEECFEDTLCQKKTKIKKGRKGKNLNKGLTKEVFDSIKK